jgi:type VI secretion system secreted protein Hcp
MASDAYLRFDGIKGESQDHAHKEWIEISGVRWAIQQPKSATASTAGGHTAERAELSEVSFEKLCDLSSPILMQTCAMGKTIPKATLEFMRADGDGNPIKYFEIELDNVLIGRISPILGVGILQERHRNCAWDGDRYV